MNKVKCSKYPEEKCFYCEKKVFEPCKFCKHNLYQDIRFRDKLEDCFVADYELAHKKLIIFAEIASGKDTVADYLVRAYNYKKLKLGKKIRSEVDNYAKLLDIPKEKSRELYVKYGQGMRACFGQDIWCEEVVSEMDRLNHDRYIVADGRQISELDFFIKKGFTPIALISDKEKRKERVINRDGYNQTGDKYELSETEIQARLCISKIKKFNGIVIENNSTLANLYKKIDEIMKNI